MPQSSFLYGGNPNRLICKYGGLALPNGQGVMPQIDLNDSQNWYVDPKSIDIKIDHRLSYSPLVWRSKSAYIATDDWPMSIKWKGQYSEVVQPLGAVKAQLLLADEQQLTFDNLTYVLAKLKDIPNPKLRTRRTPFWWDVDLDWVCREPWSRDMLLSGSGANLLAPNGGFEFPGATQTLFRSVGTDATGTLNAWTTDAGAPSIAANVVTVPASASLRAGHLDWWDLTFQARFQFATNSQPSARFRAQASNNYYTAIATGANLQIWTVIAGVFTNISTVAFVPVNGTSYWFQIVLTGTTLQAKVFADNAGAINLGSLLATTSATDTTFATGQIGFYNNGAASCTFGGAFANVCQVTGIAPQGWTPSTIAGEPAYAWSKVLPFAGTYSASVFNGHASGNGYWGANPSVSTTASLYTISSEIKATGAGAAKVQFGNAGTAVNTVIQDNTWRAATATGTPNVNDIVVAQMNGAGTAYFDNLGVWATPGASVAPAFTDATAIVNAPTAAPVGAPAAGGALTAGTYKLYYTYVTASGETAGSPLSANVVLAAANLQIAVSGVGTLPAWANAVRWYFAAGSPTIGFTVQNNGAAFTLNTAGNGVGGPGATPATSLAIAYAGSVWTEPVWTLTIPLTNGGVVTQFVLTNTMSGEALTCNFGAGLAASTAWTITIDCGAETITDQNGNQYDWSGSFPLLYQPAGTSNPHTAAISATGASSGIALHQSYVNRWSL